MSDRDFWVWAARRVALRRYLGAWLEGFLPTALGIAVLTAVVVLGARLMGRGDGDFTRGWDWFWGAIGLAGVVCGVVAGRHGYTVADGLARLDEVGRLNNRLISAYAGVGPWPARQAGIRDTVRWRWGRLGMPVMAAALVLAAAVLVEIPRLNITARPTEEPIAWTQLASWLQTLEQAKVLDQPALEKVKEQLGDLRNQPEKDWYSQSSLEAGDALRQQTGESLRALEQNLENAAELMGQAQVSMPEGELRMLTESLKQTAQGLQSGNLAANRELTGKLGSFNPSSLRAMSPAEMQALQQRLAAGAKICSQCVGPSLGGTNAAFCNSQLPSGHPGGGGPADLNLDDTAENLRTKRVEGASNPDPSRALPAEVLAITKGKHQVDTHTPTGPVEAGAISSAGEGGEAVWRDSLTPDERQVLQNYFK